MNQRLLAISLVSRKKELLSDILFWEKSLALGDFHDFANLVRAKKELKEINEILSSETMENYEKILR